jgi:hypothetical protein
MAQQGGVGDPLTLAASGVLIPYVTSGGTVSIVEVASPVGQNPNLHMQFFDANCNIVGPSVGMPLTTNDIAFQVVNSSQGGTVPDGTNGLVAISAAGPDGFSNGPLESPIHTRVYTFNASDGRSRVIEPIILDTAEFPGDPHTWSPMRTAATFFSPLQTTVVRTQLILICPKTTIQGQAGAYFGTGAGEISDNGFPVILPTFPGPNLPTAPHLLRARVYDTNEAFLRNVLGITCICFTQKNLEDPLAIDAIYGNAVAAQFGTYTELEEDPNGPHASTFTGYRAVFTVGSPLNNFFGRLSNGSRTSIQGTVSSER